MAEQKYTVISKLDAGGMAEVWKGKASSLQGFDKIVAIKRVLPQLSKNDKFIQMFLDEAKLSLYLNHANIVQTFDIGKADQSYFIVMEWIDGANLKGILEIAAERGFRVPREQAVFIAIEMCKGLSHAHNRKDPDGKPLNIVHRDISPPNVLISREGEIKLVDFGLAKAASQAVFTDPGIVKGKFAYLSPEAALGQPVDFRTDVFATGIVLWEMLTGRRLFDGKNDLETVKMVRAAEIPSLASMGVEAEPQLEGILRRALARDPHQRYQSSEQLGHELASYLASNKLLVTSYDIAVLVKRALDEKARSTAQQPAIMNSGANRLADEMQKALGDFTSIGDLEELERQEFQSVADVDPDSSLNIMPDAVDPSDWMNDFGIFDGDETIIDPNLHNRADLTRPRDNTKSPKRGRPKTSRPVSPAMPPSVDTGDRSQLPPPPVSSAPQSAPPARAPVARPPAGPPGVPPPGPERAVRPSVERIQDLSPPDRAGVKTANLPRTDNALVVGVVLGVLGAAAVIGAAWFIFF